MQRFSNVLVIFAIILLPVYCWAEPPSIYIEQVSCVGGPFGLRLPQRLPEVMKLGLVEREEVNEVEKWEGYTATRKYVYFSGFTLGLVVFSNDPNRYMVSFAEVTGPQWSHIVPFHVGESLQSIQHKLGPAAANDPELKASYGGEGGGFSFESSGSKIKKVTYVCYTG